MGENKNTQGNTQCSQDRCCTLLVPGLLDLPTAERESAFAQAGRLPELECFFSRAQQQDFSVTGLEATLFSLFDVDVPMDVDVPVAPVAYVGETGKKETDWCLRADPVQLIPDRDHLVLMGPESLSLSQAEANQLVTELNAQFAEDGWHIDACTPARWYLHQPNTPKLRTYSLAQVRGHSIDEYLPKGGDGKQWHRLMNEIQMVLHSSKVNRQRQSEGQPPVSSLWFWGGGEAPEINHSRWSELCSDEPLSLGLAALSNTSRRNVPQNATAWLNESIAPGEHLLVLDELSRYQQHGETGAWLEQMRVLEQEWLAPLLDALRRKRINELILCTCNGSRFTLTRPGLRRWWRRKKPLATIAMQAR